MLITNKHLHTYIYAKNKLVLLEEINYCKIGSLKQHKQTNAREKCPAKHSVTAQRQMITEHETSSQYYSFGNEYTGRSDIKFQDCKQIFLHWILCTLCLMPECHHIKAFMRSTHHAVIAWLEHEHQGY